MMRMRSAALVLLALLMPAVSGAVMPGEQLADPALEARAREISRDLRCQVCQNQSIDDSNAPLAADLRRLVRERLQRGETNAQVLDHVVARYGDYVRLTPPLRPDTVLLWAAPALILVAGGLGIAIALRRRTTAGAPEAPPLSDEERRALRRLVGGDDGKRAG
jgi:cytochrome c-type biogenesis protein CcmH